MGNGSKIKAAPNGPYLVENAPELKNSKGETLESNEVTALCRCGRSENKPYCDGTHAKVGFSGEREGDDAKNKRDSYEGEALAIHDHRFICAHSAICTGGLPTVFKYGEEPWIDPDGADAEAIQKQIAACPSGALSYSVEGVEHSDADDKQVIYIAKNGPYAVRGGVELEDPATGQTPQTTAQYTLCRCGGSKNKPFCDGTHWQGFVDDNN